MSDLNIQSPTTTEERLWAAQIELSRLRTAAKGKALIRREVLQRLVEIADEHCDCGPRGEGWQSNELIAAIEEAKQALDA